MWRWASCLFSLREIWVILPKNIFFVFRFSFVCSSSHCWVKVVSQSHPGVCVCPAGCSTVALRKRCWPPSQLKLPKARCRCNRCKLRSVVWWFQMKRKQQDTTWYNKIQQGNKNTIKFGTERLVVIFAVAFHKHQGTTFSQVWICFSQTSGHNFQPGLDPFLGQPPERDWKRQLW